MRFQKTLSRSINNKNNNYNMCYVHVYGTRLDQIQVVSLFPKLPFFNTILFQFNQYTVSNKNRKVEK